ncbi:MAG: hypothetical protein OEY89_09825 [Gammaproteobacteria bacterium]|nr:hypothetical protein [Gammaproteobacteria bacterium]
MIIESNIDLLEEILGEWELTIGKDFEGYKNHVYRMVNFCLALKICDREERDKIIIAGCFHDIGIWIEKTIDYIPPSIPPAKKYLTEHNLEHWTDEITLMIQEHHKITKYCHSDYPLVELFRQGDLVDFSLGTIKFGLPKEHIKNVKSMFSNAGFHMGLVRKSSTWFLKHPFNPFPMMKW